VRLCCSNTLLALLASLCGREGGATSRGGAGVGTTGAFRAAGSDAGGAVGEGAVVGPGAGAVVVLGRGGAGRGAVVEVQAAAATAKPISTQ
jgi:hypothetical protein